MPLERVHSSGQRVVTICDWYGEEKLQQNLEEAMRSPCFHGPCGANYDPCLHNFSRASFQLHQTAHEMPEYYFHFLMSDRRIVLRCSALLQRVTLEKVVLLPSYHAVPFSQFCASNLYKIYISQSMIIGFGAYHYCRRLLHQNQHWKTEVYQFLNYSTIITLPDVWAFSWPKQCKLDYGIFDNAKSVR